MIDYYLHKKCSLVRGDSRPAEQTRCGGCVWLDRKVRACIFSLDFSRCVTLDEFSERLRSVDPDQQKKLAEPWRRFTE